MTQRSIPAAVMADLQNPSGVDALLWFLTLTHENLSEPIRLVSDQFDYVVDGDFYQGVVFGGRALTDTDETPSSELTVPNVDKRIGQSLQQATGRARVEMRVLSSAEFDLTQEPRVAIVAHNTLYRFTQFHLAEVQVTAAEAVARLILADYSQEPWPVVRATADRTPGLFV